MSEMNNRERLSPWLGKKNPQHADWMRNAFKNHQIKNHNMQTYIKCSCGKEVMSIHMSRHLKANHKSWFNHQM